MTAGFRLIQDFMHGQIISNPVAFPFADQAHSQPRENRNSPADSVGLVGVDQMHIKNLSAVGRDKSAGIHGNHIMLDQANGPDIQTF